ncbi:MAG: PaaI family thioesterase [Mycobacterium sp.]
MLEFTHEDWSPAEVARMREVYQPLTESVRELVDAAIRTEADPETVAAVTSEIDAAVARLRQRQMPGSFGVRVGADGQGISWGNAVIGIRNPLAPPVITSRDGSGAVRAEFELGAAYEGPPGHVHGGVAALILDHLLGEAASPDQKPRFTGSITVRYLRATRLGPLRARAVRTRSEGVKTYCAGHIADEEGITVEAEGVFITPRWLREAGS